MASLGNPKLWVPYMNTKDCSQGFCSLYCPQWCYVIFPPPPPPPPFGFPDDDSRPNFSPLVIAIIALLATAFLLVSYYAVIRKYFGKNESRRNQNHNPDGGLHENHDPSFSSSSAAVSVLHEPWHFVSTNGLDEALIKSITVCKYKKGDGLVEGTDCSVCLSEFEEDEMLRLLPKCSHAFHLTCIDTWLKSHSNCPLCRASIVCGNASPSRVPIPVAETPQLEHESSSESEQPQNENLGIAEHLESNNGDEEENQNRNNVVSKSPSLVFSDLGNLERRETVIEIREEGDQQTRRSVSMDYSRQVPSIADMLLLNQDEGTGMDEIDDGSSKRAMGESSSQSWHRNKGVLLHYVMNPVTMKRSFSSGKFFFKRHGRGRDPIIF